MKGVLARAVATALALAAIAFAAVSVVTIPAEAEWPEIYQHSCYAGCCYKCQGGLCCYDEPPIPDLPPLPERR
jgi:hypothetical protein